MPASVRNAVAATGLQRAYWPAVALIVIGGLALRVITFTAPWTGVHNAWGGAFYGNVARNFLRYGYWQTGFAPMVSSGVVDPDQFQFYYHHPVLSMWLTGVSFHLFGVHEWSARLAPLVFSLLTMALVWRFANAAFDRTTALFAVLFMAIFPVDAYYATHLDPYGSMAIFFTALALAGYWRWLESGRDRDFALCAIAIGLGCMTAWYTYLVLPGMLVHGWFIHRQANDRRIRLMVFGLGVVSLVVFGFFFLHRLIALSGAPPEMFDPLAERFLKRTVNLQSGRLAILQTYLRQFWDLYTPPVVALTVGWVAWFLHGLRTRQLRTADWCVAILLSYGFLYMLAFPGHIPGHDYFVRACGPGIALACGVVVSRMTNMLAGPATRMVTIGALLVVICAVATWRTATLYRDDDGTNGPLLRGFAEAVTAVSTPRDPIFMPIPGDQVLAWYVDRPLVFGLDSAEKLAAATSTVTAPYLILVPERNAGEYPELLSQLQKRYPERRDKGLLIFQGGASDRPR